MENHSGADDSDRGPRFREIPLLGWDNIASNQLSLGHDLATDIYGDK